MSNRAKKYLEQVGLLEVMIGQREAEYTKILTERGSSFPKSVAMSVWSTTLLTSSTP